MAKNIRRIVVFADKKEVDHLLPTAAAKEYGNRRFWDGGFRFNADAVYAPDYPEIEEVYKASGRRVYRPEVQPAPTTQPVDEKPAGEPVTASEDEDQGEPEDTPMNWRDLSWPKMRSLAKQFTDEPIKSKEQAEEILIAAEGEGKL